MDLVPSGDCVDLWLSSGDGRARADFATCRHTVCLGYRRAAELPFLSIHRKRCYLYQNVHNSAISAKSS